MPMNGCTSPLEPTGVNRKCATRLTGRAVWPRGRGATRPSSVTARSNLDASSTKPGVGPVHRSASTSSNRSMSLRRVASVRNRNARSRSSESVRASVAGVGRIDAPFARIKGNVFEMPILRQDCRRRLGAPSAQSGITVSGIADECQVIRNRLRPDPELLDHGGFVAGDARPAIELDDAIAAHALRQIFVRRADHDPFDAISRAAATAPAANASSASNSIIGQTTTPSRDKRLFEQRELRQQIRIDAGPRLVAGPQIVSERLNDVVGGDARHVSHRR